MRSGSDAVIITRSKTYLPWRGCQGISGLRLDAGSFRAATQRGEPGQSNTSGASSQDDVMNSLRRVSTRHRQDSEKVGRQGGCSDSQQEEDVTPPVQADPEEPLTKSIAGMIRDLAVEVSGSFETSNTNQKEISGLCKALRQTFADLAERTAALEINVCDLRRATEDNREAIQQVKVGEVQLKLEKMENKLRRNNLRFLKVPEGLEGGDLKGLVVRLIKQGVQVEDEEED
ncbi:hypothetical protein NDU88_001101 [Pleurodeles waltl]|uniref:Uncharacterized protein n=1 Tax=Pleurodeles waltl TaxID=8319 RepID=A0AAV7WJV8_PLEWA|nr:hypothetical protein NDU88_001101 [Pleurodeles waltl]